MIKTNVKKIFIIFMIIICLFINIKSVKAVNTIENKARMNNITQDYGIDINNEEQLSSIIKDLILTINSEGMKKSVLSQTINLYVEATEKYTNKDIARIIEDNRIELEQNGVSSQDLNSVTALLRNIDTNQLRKVLEQINIDDISNKIEKGESLQKILQDLTGNMSTSDKVSLAVNLLLSAYIIKITLIILIILFLYRTLLRCVIYKKAGQRAWAPFIPIYRNVVMLKICNMNPWWLLLLLIPIIGWAFLWIVSVASKFMLAEGFGKGTGFAFGLWLLAPIFETSLVFSKKTKYIGFEEE